MKRFIIEIGTGIDQHGQDYTNSACKAVKDAIARSCLVGLVEVLKVTDWEAIMIEVTVASPSPEKVDTDAVAECLPFGKKNIKIVKGGMSLKGIEQEEFGDTSNRLVVSNAGIVVWVDV